MRRWAGCCNVHPLWISDFSSPREHRARQAGRRWTRLQHCSKRNTMLLLGIRTAGDRMDRGDGARRRSFFFDGTDGRGRSAEGLADHLGGSRSTTIVCKSSEIVSTTLDWWHARGSSAGDKTNDAVGMFLAWGRF